MHYSHHAVDGIKKYLIIGQSLCENLTVDTPLIFNGDMLYILRHNHNKNCLLEVKLEQFVFCNLLRTYRINKMLRCFVFGRNSSTRPLVRRHFVVISCCHDAIDHAVSVVLSHAACGFSEGCGSYADFFRIRNAKSTLQNDVTK